MVGFIAIIFIPRVMESVSIVSWSRSRFLAILVVEFGCAWLKGIIIIIIIINSSLPLALIQSLKSKNM